MAAFRRSSRRTTRPLLRRRRRVFRQRRTLRFRRSYRRTRMSRRRVLNISSNKKRDARMPFSNINNPGDPPSATTAVLSAGIQYIIPHVVTAMDKTPATAVVDIENYRTKSDIYFRGYKENMTFIPNNGNAWIWRRVCFTLRGGEIYQNETITTPLRLEVAPQGFTRTITNANGSALGTAILDVLFRGEQGQDWSSVFNAPTDNRLVTVMYDKTRTLLGGNGESRLHNYRIWHPMNKNFHYDDAEAGSSELSSVYHTMGKQGMGDYYIVDFITCSNTTPGSATMGFIPNGILYWHER